MGEECGSEKGVLQSGQEDAPQSGDLVGSENHRSVLILWCSAANTYFVSFNLTLPSPYSDVIHGVGALLFSIQGVKVFLSEHLSGSTGEVLRLSAPEGRGT